MTSSGALGVEHRSEEASYSPDLMVQKGQIAGTTGQPTQGDYSLNEVYLELQVPLLADMAFARELSLDMAGRYSDYNNFGSTTNTKFGLKWKPIDSLLVRATYGTGFRAPTVEDLYGGTTSTRDSYTDPCDTSFGAAANNPQVPARCSSPMVSRPTSASSPLTAPPRRYRASRVAPTSARAQRRAEAGNRQDPDRGRGLQPGVRLGPGPGAWTGGRSASTT